MDWFILERDGEFKINSSWGNPTYGMGSWNVFDSTPYQSEADAEAALETWAIRVASMALLFSRKQVGFKELKEAIKL